MDNSVAEFYNENIGGKLVQVINPNRASDEEKRRREAARGNKQTFV